MENLTLYNKFRNVPQEAQKKITGGRISGMTDINPMWRIKKLTEEFGVCGIGWKFVITKQWIEIGGKEEKSAFTNIDLFIKIDSEWSDAIPGTGGSSFIAAEKNGLYTSDECFKMALTDAISVACKSLGIGADVYFERDKYDTKPKETLKPQLVPDTKQWVAAIEYLKKDGTIPKIKEKYELSEINEALLKNAII